MAYILGEREFFGRVLRTDRRALIPRPETETLVEVGLRAVDRWRERGVEPRVVDVGTGSGAIAVCVAAASGARVVATDRSWPALTLARENVAAQGQAARVWLLQADLLDGLRGAIHVLLANLPYVPRSRPLPPDVVRFEPHLALFAGPGGGELVQRLLEQARRLLVPGAEVALEVDAEGQAEPLAGLASALYPGATVEVLRDAAGLERLVRVRLPEER